MTALSPDALEALAGRLEAGECGREIDALVWAAEQGVQGPVEFGREIFSESASREYAGFPGGQGEWLDLIATVSTDLTACEDFRERVLPGAYWEDLTEDSGKQSWSATLNRPFGAGDAPTEPAARLAATLRALAAKIREEDHA